MAKTSSDRPSTFPWPPALLAGAIGLALGLDWLVIRLPIPFAETSIVHFAAMTVMLAGLVLIVWAALQFRSHQTSIRPDRGSERLVAAGPFAFSRNPIYLGEVMALVGAGVSFNRLWLVLVAPVFAIAVTRLAIQREEAYLERRFGSAFTDYRSRVRRWL
jgi:protein-S-isoprenylcysteine O-methyltransferase Ste14